MSLRDSEPHASPFHPYPDVTLCKQSDSTHALRHLHCSESRLKAYAGGTLTHVPTLSHSTFICIPNGYILPTYPLGRLPYGSRWL